MSKIKNDGLDQYGAEPFEHQQFGPAGIEGLLMRPSMAEQFQYLFLYKERVTAVDDAMLLTRSRSTT